jgi:periplasmic protein CpxP/Spy
MKSSKKLQIILFVLLIINTIGMIYIYLKPSETHKHHKRALAELVIKTLNLDTEQQIAYEKLILQHRASIHQLENKRFKTKQAYFQLLNEADDSLKIEETVIKLESIQGEIETTHFKHFKDIRALCKPNQLDSFKTLTHHFSRFFSPPPMPDNK